MLLRSMVNDGKDASQLVARIPRWPVSSKLLEGRARSSRRRMVDVGTARVLSQS